MVPEAPLRRVELVTNGAVLVDADGTLLDTKPLHLVGHPDRASTKATAATTGFREEVRAFP